MARYEHLPIYKTAMELAVYIEEMVRNFSRYHKYGVGSDLRDDIRQIIRLIVRANSREDKTPVLQELAEACEQLKILLILCKYSFIP